MLFTSQTLAVTVVLSPNGDFRGILKQYENLLDIKGFWSTNNNDVVELSFIVSWKDRCKHSHLTAFAGCIYKDCDNIRKLDIKWMSIEEGGKDVHRNSSDGHVLLSNGDYHLMGEEFHDSINPFENSDFLLNQAVVPSEFVSRITGMDLNVIATFETNQKI